MKCDRCNNEAQYTRVYNVGEPIRYCAGHYSLAEANVRRMTQNIQNMHVQLLNDLFGSSS